MLWDQKALQLLPKQLWRARERARPARMHVLTKGINAAGGGALAAAADGVVAALCARLLANEHVSAKGPG